MTQPLTPEEARLDQMEAAGMTAARIVAELGADALWEAAMRTGCTQRMARIFAVITAGHDQARAAAEQTPTLFDLDPSQVINPAA